MKIIDIKPRTADWHQWRSEGIGASESSVILSESPYKTPWQLWAEKCGFIFPEPLDNNPNVQRGIRLEPIARAYLEEKFQELLLPLCAQSDNYPFIRASFDGINSKGEPVEIKCPSQTVFEEVQHLGINSPTYLHYMIQVQHQLLVSDSKSGWLIFYSQDTKANIETLSFKITRDEEIIAKIITAAQSFWDLVQTQKPPIKCPNRDTYIPEGEDKVVWQSLASKYHQFAKQAHELNLQLDEVKSEISNLEKSFLPLMHNFAYAEYAGVKIVRYWSQGQVDYSKLLVDLGHQVTTSQLNHYRKMPIEKIRFTSTNFNSQANLNESKQSVVPSLSNAKDEMEKVHILAENIQKETKTKRRKAKSTSKHENTINNTPSNKGTDLINIANDVLPNQEVTSLATKDLSNTHNLDHALVERQTPTSSYYF
ncbi:YqaJ viral recombinase family protein [Thorsellia anophelis]|uniref:Putative phage-type endonuclease n=1 Tax=Thorsellia anophelis DSM 18579 TaxID=1123402 RepID=A0A1I0CWH2_9GAMM|nr:YqaJ viral recombinase family protein [Thorsellia anophelis]SET23784.1 putative phage-type endonuclease [Thorsellia anophelis DSM 18579]